MEYNAPTAAEQLAGLDALRAIAVQQDRARREEAAAARPRQAWEQAEHEITRFPTEIVAPQQAEDYAPDDGHGPRAHRSWTAMMAQKALAVLTIPRPRRGT